MKRISSAAVAVLLGAHQVFAGPVAAGPLALRQSGTFVPKPGYFPEKGDDTIAGGIFCISLSDLATYLQRTGNNPGATGSESPKGAGAVTSGSGPYPAAMVSDSSLPNHTIYAPKSPPANITLPFISWGNGGCAPSSSSYRNMLTEIASYGYVIAADGPATGSGSGQTKVQDQRDSLDWAMKGGASKYGNINLENITTAGHSCGGLEAMSTAYHDTRVKRIMMFDIAIFQDDRRYLLQEIKVPVAWFVGGPKDMGYPNAEKDYALLNAGLPAYKASLDTGHGGTYGATNGGKFGKAAVAYLQWQYRNDAKSKAVLLDPASQGSLVSDHWNVTYKNWT
ncbi:hypothetical protein JX265_002369 [Neoarthrinium moseri]|uniref:Chlorophyllase n=1 Tax=Neoarthrinium moseri TaxID=1658444 RepID=A0A9P9WUT6_9PEZI|nr:uncharacterized protein JN550_000183 [Neoarthrinium moseri]KAI1854732.1 hypothetical protein JX266_000850 [Neoarthrinium moseri]KAI1878001.1 hypothetical protein JN550_000183 [Neoarthrinium moseri]KAI1879415.1 hypothetical protein JX265_002369 [Neoarthrinium moseri]